MSFNCRKCSTCINASYTGHIYIYIYQMDCVCQRYHKECSTRTCADDCYYSWKKYIWLELGLFSIYIYKWQFHLKVSMASNNISRTRQDHWLWEIIANIFCISLKTLAKYDTHTCPAQKDFILWNLYANISSSHLIQTRNTHTLSLRTNRSWGSY